MRRSTRGVGAKGLAGRLLTAFSAFAVVGSSLSVGLPAARAGVNAVAPDPPIAGNRNAFVHISTQVLDGNPGAQDLAVAPNGTVYSVGDNGNITRRLPDGTASAFAPGTGYVEGIAVNHDGDIFVAAGGNPKRISPDGTITSLGYLPAASYGVGVDDEGNAYYSTTDNTVVEIKPDLTQVVVVPSSAGLSFPTGVAVSPGGGILVADSNNNRVLQYLDGVATTFASTCSHPNAIVFTPNSNLLVTCFGSSESYATVLSPAGEDLTHLSAGDNAPIRGAGVDAAGNVYTVGSRAGATKLYRFAQELSANPGARQATVNWIAPPHDGGSAITSYTATASPGGATCTVSDPNPDANGCTVTGLDTTTSYTFTVTATNAAGTSSPSASSAAVTPWPAAPTAPLAPFGTKASSSTTIVAGLDSPHGVGSDAAGNLYVANFNTYELRRYRDDGTFSVLATPCAPHGIAVAGVDDVYVADWCGTVLHHQPDGTVVEVGGGFTHATDVEIAPNGTLYISDEGQGAVYEIATDGARSVLALGLGKVSAIAYSPTDGAVFAVNYDTGDVSSIAADGTVATVLNGPLARYSEGLAVDHNGDVAVSAPTLHEVIAFHPDGSGAVEITNAPISGPLDLAFEASGDLLVSDIGTNTVKRLSFAPTVTTGQNSATVHWSPPVDDGGGALTSYEVQATTDPGLVCTYDVATDTGLSCTVTGLDSRTAYQFKVRAANSSGSGPWSTSTLEVRPTWVPSAPTDATAVARGSRGVEVSWNPPVEDGGEAIAAYKVTSSPSGLTCTYVVSKPEQDRCTIGDLPIGVAQTFSVTAENSVGVGPASDATTELTRARSSPSQPLPPPTAEILTTTVIAPDFGGSTTYVGGGYDAEGNRYIVARPNFVDRLSYTVERTAPDGTLTELPTGLPWVKDVAVTPAGAVYLNDVVAGMQRMDPEGSVAPVPGMSGWVNNIATDALGRLYVLQANQVKRVEFDGSVSTVLFNPMSTYRTMGVSPAGTVWLGDWSGRLFRVEADGSLTSAGDSWLGITAITPDDAGNVFWSNGMGSVNLRPVGGGQVEVASAMGISSIGLSPDGRMLFVGMSGGASELSRRISAVPADHRVSVSWSPPLEDGGAAVTGYTVTASPGGQTCTYDVAKDSGFRCTVRELDNGTPYTFTVVATNEVGAGLASPPSQEVVPNAKVPDVPTEAKATAADSSVEVSWTPPEDDGGKPITSYTASVVGDATRSCTYAVPTDGSPELDRCVVEGLVNGTGYVFTVVATNEVGSSDPSAMTTIVTPVALPSRPTGMPGDFTDLYLNSDVGWASVASTDGGAIFAIDLDGKLWIADPGSGASLVESVTNAQRVAMDAAGNALVTTGSELLKVAPSLTVTKVADLPTTTGAALAVGGDGAVYVGDAPGGAIWKVAKDGSVSLLIDSVPCPTSLAVSPYDQVLYTACDGLAYAVVGAFTVELVGLANVSSLFVTKANTTYEVSRSSAKLRVYPGNGGSYEEASLAAREPSSLVLTSDGTVLVAEGVAGGTIYRSSGEATASAGGRSARIRLLPPISDGGATITSYEVQAVDDATKTCTYTVFPGTNLGCTVEGLTPGQRYRFEVRARNKVGLGAASTTNEVVVQASVPTAPQNATAVRGNGQVDVSWTPPADDGGSAVTSYTATAVEDATKSCTYGVPSDGSPEADTCTVTGLSNGSTYTFTVVATNSAGDSVASAATDPVTPSSTPGQPLGPPSGFQVWGSSTDVGWYWVAESPGGALWTVDVLGKLSREAYGFTVDVPEITKAHALLANDDGSVLVTTEDALYRVGPDLSVEKVADLPSIFGGSMVLAGDGSVLVTDGPEGKILSVASDGTVTERYTGLDAPEHLASSSDGTLYFTSSLSNATYRLNPLTGTTAAVTGVAFPSGLAIGRNDVMYEIDPLSNELMVLPLGGKPTYQPISLTQPHSLSVSARGDAIVTGEWTPGGHPYAAMLRPVATNTGRSADVSWYPPEYDGGSPITSYTVMVSGDPSKYCTYDVAKDSGLHCKVTGLQEDEGYTFTVVATNINGDGPPASTEQAMITVAAPGPPEYATARAGQASAVVSWLPPADDGGAPVTSYTATAVEDETKSCTYAVPDNGEPETDTCTVEGLTNGVSYSFKVTASNARGEGEAALTSSVTPADPPSQPTAVPVALRSVSSPYGVAYDAEGNLYVAAASENQVYRYGVDGTVGTVGTGYSYPTGLAVDGAGNVYVADFWGSRVVEVHPDGTQEDRVTGVSRVRDVAFDPSGRLWVVSDYSIFLVAEDGTKADHQVWDGATWFPETSQIAFDSAGNLYEADFVNQRIMAISADLTTTWSVMSNVGGLWGIDFDASDNLYISTGGQVLRRAPDGTVAVYAKGLSGTRHVAVSPDGEVAVADWGANQVSNVRIAAVAGGRSASVHWAPPEVDGGSPVTGYSVSAVEDPTKGCDYVVPTDGSPEEDSCTVLGLEVGKTYTFAVTARNVVANGPPSEVSNAVKPFATAPDAVGSPDLGLGNRSALVSWSASANDGGSPITRYQVDALDLVSGRSSGCTASVSETSCTVRGLVNGATYTFVVRAFNAVGASTAAVAGADAPAGLASAPVGPAGADPAGSLVQGDFDQPVAMAGDEGEGLLYVIDQAGPPIIRSLDPVTGEVAKFYDGTLLEPRSIAVGSNGEVYVSDCGTGTLLAINPSGVLDHEVDLGGCFSSMGVGADGKVYGVGSSARSVTAVNVVDGTSSESAAVEGSIMSLTSNGVGELYLLIQEDAGPRAAYRYDYAADTFYRGLDGFDAYDSMAMDASLNVVLTSRALGVPTITLAPRPDLTGYQPSQSVAGSSSWKGTVNAAFALHQAFVIHDGGVHLITSAPTAEAGPGSAKVSFGQSLDDGGSPVTSYIVTASPGGKTCTWDPSSGGDAGCTVEGLTHGVAYTFSVSAENAQGRSAASAPSNSVTAGEAPPSAPRWPEGAKVGDPVDLATELSIPHGVAIDAAGNTYVADWGNSRVLRYDESGASSTIGSGLNYPKGVAIGPNGDVYIADTGNNRVVVVDATGSQRTLVSTTAWGLHEPTGIAVAPNGDVFVCMVADNVVSGFHADGTFFGGDLVNSPDMLTFSPDGKTLYITDYVDGEVIRFDPETSFSTTEITGLNHPRGVAADANGVYVAAQGSGEIQFYPYGDPTKQVVAKSSDVLGLAVDGNGRIVYSEPFTGKLREAFLAPSVQVEGFEVTVQWSEPADDGGSPITGYSVLDETGTVLCTTKAEDANWDSCTGTEFVGDHRFRVVATNAVGTSPPSAWSATTTVAPHAVPGTPLSPHQDGGPIDLPEAGVRQAIQGYDGALYTLHGDGEVHRFSPEDGESGLVLTVAPEADSIGVSGDGTVFATYGDVVLAYPAHGGEPKEITVAERPARVLGGPGGTALLSDPFNGKVWKVSRSGWATPYLSGLVTPYAMTRDLAGNLYVSQLIDQSVLVVAPSGAQRTIHLSGFITDISTDGLGNLYYVDAITGAFYERTRDGLTVNLAESWQLDPSVHVLQITWFKADLGEVPVFTVAVDGPVPPGAYFLLIAPEANPVDGGLEVSWGEPSTDGGSPITGYTATAYPGGHSCTYDTEVDEGLTCTIEGLQNGKRYRVEVTATNAVGTSAPSFPSMPARPSGPPSPPTAVKAVRGDGAASVSWNAPARDGGTPISGYDVTASTPGSDDVYASCKSPANCQLTGLTNGTTYQVTVAARNEAGRVSDPSAAVSVTPSSPRLKPGAPTGVTVTGQLQGLKATWTAASTGDAPASYTASAKDPKGQGASCTVLAPDTSCSVGGLVPGTSYKVTVVATNAVGASPASAPSATAVALGLPGAPTAATATALATAAKVSWSAPASNGFSPITSYTASADHGGSSCTVQVAPGSPLSCTVGDLVPFEDYSFTVVATTVAGDSEPSAPSAALSPFDFPSQPSAPEVEAGDGRLRAWAAVSASPGSEGAITLVYTAVASGPDGSVASTCSYVDPSLGCMLPDLVNGTEYQVTVTAANPGGSSDPSTPALAIPLGLPTEPRDLEALAGNGVVDLSWTVPASTGGEGVAIDDYTVDVSPDAGSCSVDLVELTARCSGLSNGTTYRFTVQAVNERGSSEPSAPTVATPATTPGVVRKPGAVPANASATVSWQEPASDGGSRITRYEVSSTPAGPSCSTTTTSCTLTGLTNGVAYTFTVRAGNELGLGPSASTKRVAPKAPPAGSPSSAPTGLRAVAADASATFTWTKVKGATAYSVAVSPGATCSVLAGKATATCTGLTNGDGYRFRVAAMNTKGLGPWSEPSAEVTPLGAPGSPRDLAVVARRGIIVASWKAPLANGGLALTGYTATVTGPGGKLAGTCDIGASTTTCRVEGLSTTTAYNVSVVASNRFGRGVPASAGGLIPAFAFRVIATPTSSLQVALGSGGAIYRSTDGGSHFTPDSSPTLSDLSGVVCRLGGRYCLAVGQSGTLLTWNAPDGPAVGPAIWHQVSVPTSADLKAVRCMSTGGCVAVGMDGTMLYGAPVTDVVNGKVTVVAAPTEWTTVDLPAAAGRVLSNVDCNVGTTAKPLCVVVGDHGFLAVTTPTTNGSSTSTLAVRNLTADLRGLRCVTDGICVAVGANGTVLVGTGSDLTKAKSWRLLPAAGSKGSVVPAGVNLNAVACPTVDLCLAVGTRGTVIASAGTAKAPAGTDAWSLLPTRTRQDFTAVRCTSLTTCFAVGGGHVYQITRASKTAAWLVRQNA